MISSITRLEIFGLSLLLAATMLPATTTAQTRPSIAGLQAQIATLQSQVIPNMAGYVTMDVSNPTRPTLRVAGANVQIVNGTSTTATINGLGNLIVGYDEQRAGPTWLPVCSIGAYTDQIECVVGFGTWAVNHKSGSHNIVVGEQHDYSSYSGFVVGYGSTINGTGATVTGGARNIASGGSATVTGGDANTASGVLSSVTGGSTGFATALNASVSGGQSNAATASYASVSGGWGNNASGDRANVSGGRANNASAPYASISGGGNNIASGSQSSVSGGFVNEASGTSSSVSGGGGRTVGVDGYWVGGNVLLPQ